MTDPDNPLASSEEQGILEFLHDLEARITRLEGHLESSPGERFSTSAEDEQQETTYPPATIPLTQHTGLESRIGEFGLAWIGSTVLLLGIMFSMSYLQNQDLPLLSALLGYVVVVGLHWFARRWEVSVPHIFMVTMISALLLLYYTTMKLHFYSGTPLIGSDLIGLLLLLGVVVYQFWFGIRHDSRFLVILAILLGIVSALLVDAGWLTLLLITAMAISSVMLTENHSWAGQGMVAIPIIYVGYLLWLMGNPIAGNTIGLQPEHHFSLFFLTLSAIIFIRPVFQGAAEAQTDLSSVAAIIFNCLGFASIASLSVIAHFPDRYAGAFLLITLFFLSTSIILWLKTRQQFAPAIYAGFGYMALSVSIFGFTGIPDAFFWLSFQGLLVVSMALWFRSKILVVGNSLIYLTILLAYLAISSSANAVNFSFALVSLLSARTMNWQKERLTLQTELMRNIYLVIAFSFMLYAVYKAVPEHLVSPAWTLTAGLYFGMSIGLKNIKYRIMAIGTMLATVAYLFIIDLDRLDPILRVAVFLFLGVITLSVSMYYTRFRQSRTRDEDRVPIQDP